MHVISLSPTVCTDRLLTVHDGNQMMQEFTDANDDDDDDGDDDDEADMRIRS